MAGSSTLQPYLQLVSGLLVNCTPFQDRDTPASGNQDAARMAQPEGEQPEAVNATPAAATMHWFSLCPCALVTCFLLDKMQGSSC